MRGCVRHLKHVLVSRKGQNLACEEDDDGIPETEKGGVRRRRREEDRTEARPSVSWVCETEEARRI